MKVYCRTDRGDWPSEPATYHHGDTFDLPTLDRPMTVAEIYDGILDPDGRSRL